MALTARTTPEMATTQAATSGIAIAALDVSARAAKSEAPSGSQPTRPNISAAEAFTDWLSF